jgi:hypothetical protein
MNRYFNRRESGGGSFASISACPRHDGEGHRHQRQFGAAHLAVSLQKTISRFVAEANTEPKRFHWAKDPDTIIAAVRREDQVLDYSG